MTFYLWCTQGQFIKLVKWAKIHHCTPGKLIQRYLDRLLSDHEDGSFEGTKSNYLLPKRSVCVSFGLTFEQWDYLMELASEWEITRTQVISTALTTYLDDTWETKDDFHPKEPTRHGQIP